MSLDNFSDLNFFPYRNSPYLILIFYECNFKLSIIGINIMILKKPV